MPFWICCRQLAAALSSHEYVSWSLPVEGIKEAGDGKDATQTSTPHYAH
jgi:hypothetical protein